MTNREEDVAEILFTASSHDTILFFSSFGKVFRLKGYQIQETSRTSKGLHVANLLELEPEERVSAMFAISAFDEDRYLFFATEQGTVKRVSLAEFKNIRRKGLRALSLNDGDRLVNVRITNGDENMMIATAQGRAICFHETEVRAMGRTAVGVRGISLQEGDKVIGVVRARPEGEVLTVTEKGYGKRTPVTDYSVHHRGGQGIIAHALNEKTGNIAGVEVVDPDNDIMIITDEGIMIRTAASDIRVCGRSSQGVIVMRTGDDMHVNAIARMDMSEDELEEQLEEAENAETAEPTEEVLEHGEENILILEDEPLEDE